MAADPQWLRTTLCEDLAAMDHARGTIPDTRTIEAIIDRDIAVWAAHEREARHRYAPAVDKRKEDDCHEAAKREAAKRDMSVGVDRTVKDELVRQACACGGATCRPCKLRLRIAALIAPLPEDQRTPTKYGEHYRNCQYPSYAREVLGIWEWMKLSPRAQRLKATRRLERIVTRKLEDIADRSTAIIGLGQWR